jgi:hypothetical protein
MMPPCKGRQSAPGLRGVAGAKFLALFRVLCQEYRGLGNQDFVI